MQRLGNLGSPPQLSPPSSNSESSEQSKKKETPKLQKQQSNRVTEQINSWQFVCTPIWDTSCCDFYYTRNPRLLIPIWYYMVYCGICFPAISHQLYFRKNLKNPGDSREVFCCQISEKVAFLLPPHKHQGDNQPADFLRCFVRLFIEPFPNDGIPALAVK